MSGPPRDFAGPKAKLHLGGQYAKAMRIPLNVVEALKTCTRPDFNRVLLNFRRLFLKLGALIWSRAPHACFLGGPVSCEKSISEPSAESRKFPPGTPVASHGRFDKVKIESISKEINCPEHEYISMFPSLIELATPLSELGNTGPLHSK